MARHLHDRPKKLDETPFLSLADWLGIHGWSLAHLFVSVTNYTVLTLVCSHAECNQIMVNAKQAAHHLRKPSAGMKAGNDNIEQNLASRSSHLWGQVSTLQ